eukprot:scaffold95161_cov39-Phaeocystis_antarctica.AAC.1
MPDAVRGFPAHGQRRIRLVVSRTERPHSVEKTSAEFHQPRRTHAHRPYSYITCPSRGTFFSRTPPSSYPIPTPTTRSCGLGRTEDIPNA